MEEILYYCENCNQPVYKKFASGRFCSRKCSNTISQKKQLFICPECGKELNTSKAGFTQHIKACYKNKIEHQQKLDTWIYSKHFCERCGKEITELYGSGRFCSRACANARDHSEETKKKISNSTKNLEYYTDINTGKSIGLHEGDKIPDNYIKGNFSISKYDNIDDFINRNKKNINEIDNNIKVKIVKPKNIKFCKDCGKQLSHKNKYGYCKTCYYNHINEIIFDETRHKLSNAGKKSASLQKRRSKNEVEFCNLCQDFFINVLHNEPIFNGWDADIILKDFNLAILWNGPFHYKEIFNGKQSLKQIQNRDRIKINEIKKCGYIPYIIKDMNKADDKKVNTEFEILLNFIQLNYQL